MSQHYRVRYRCAHRPGGAALIIEDEGGTAYLFSDGTLQVRTCGARAAERLVRRLGGPDQWTPVPIVPAYTFAGLCHLVGHQAAVRGAVAR